MAVGYIRSDKRALLTCIEAKSLNLSAQGQAAIDRQDAKIWRWRAPMSCAGSPRSRTSAMVAI